MKFSLSKLTIAALVLALSFTLATANSTWAQTGPSDAKLEAFVEAALQVENLMREYEPQIQAAETPQRADNLRRQAKAKMEAAINATPGITLDEYGWIVVATEKDKALHDRVDTIYRAAKGQ